MGTGGTRHGRILGSSAVRSVVNAGFHLSARLRLATLAEIDPVRTQESILRRLIRKSSQTLSAATTDSIRSSSVADFQRGFRSEPMKRSGKLTCAIVIPSSKI